MRTVICPPTAAGSLGDEAVVRGALEGLRQTVGPALIIEQGYPWYRDQLGVRSTAIAPRVLPVKVRKSVNTAVRAAAQRLAVDIYLPSTDVLDGFYGATALLARLTALRRIAERGTRLHFVGFSWEGAPTSITDALRTLPNARFSARDEHSREFFSAQTRLQCGLGSDLAYLVSPFQKPTFSTVERLSRWREQGLKIVGLTPNALWSERYPGIVSSLARLVRHRDMADVAFVFVPHDSRPGQSDVLLSEQILDEAGTRHDSRVMIPAVPSFLSSRGILGQVDVHVAGRMHSGIAAMSMGTPAIMISLQDKVLGVLANAKQADLAISRDHAADTDSLAALVGRTLQQASDRRLALTEELPRLRSSALKGLVGPEHVR